MRERTKESQALRENCTRRDSDSSSFAICHFRCIAVFCSIHTVFSAIHPSHQTAFHFSKIRKRLYMLLRVVCVCAQKIGSV